MPTVDIRRGRGMRTGIATVCLSGTLEDKLTAAASAGFDGVEIFENDLIAAPWSPGQIRQRCLELGLSVDLYQPFRDFDSATQERFAANLRRAEHKLELMQQLDADTILVCSSVAPDAAQDDDLIAEQLRTLADRAAERGLRIAYEALAWGRYVHTYEHSWEIVRRADHPALGVCLDSFHILSLGDDPAGIRSIPGDKLFFLQLADAPRLDMDVLQWSRHHRLFPGQGAFDLAGFLGHVLDAGYRGPLSLEVFNDVFRQADPERAAVDAMRSLLTLQERVVANRDTAARRPASTIELPAAPELAGHAFTELAVTETSGPPVADALAKLGFTHTGQHRSKPVQLWQQGEARILLNGGGRSEQDAAGEPAAAVNALAVESTDPARSAQRAEALLSPVLPRNRGADEAILHAVAAPDGTSVFFCPTGEHGATWSADFTPTGNAADTGTGLTGTDHVALTQPFDHFDEAALFYRSVLGLEPETTAEFAAPFGLIRSRAVTNPGRDVRIALSVTVLRRGEEWAPGVPAPQHIAFGTDDAIAAARAMRARGAPLLEIPGNYYDDLDARLALDPDLLAAMRAHNVLYDRDEHGEFLHFYTEVLGSRVFFEVVQRIGGYSGYGAANAPVRMAAHRRQRVTGSARRPVHT
ncbi:4-hydroxyphenylpyruvate dioxygenase [Halopolyspora algeriensis]|uniref:3-dehydroshikimate dehydratase n=1 Tax=Halopolyspora algeriensis TaxID=1500506 RepID=A0A368VUY7_9ACTN|nr:sugar phosphate isomerase/epimerase and 4-hydroxyphenylpyruvate domain-containing protein [Halopolyspora algeriensis]RCW44478.1 4-hydroxyphenylpyruvate dioxygenase [Halopolyspora algeriensis]TQM55839.1 4-hydroxyphenylpyruvate dioxygenase [Halopolyspora algeriensis]